MCKLMSWCLMFVVSVWLWCWCNVSWCVCNSFEISQTFANLSNYSMVLAAVTTHIILTSSK
jgi:hypothetical protein